MSMTIHKLQPLILSLPFMRLEDFTYANNSAQQEVNIVDEVVRSGTFVCAMHMLH